MILQRAQRHTNFNNASIEATKGNFGPTVYVDAKLNRKVHRALLDTGSNVNIMSERAYKLYSPPMLLNDFNYTVLSATNDPFRILGKFTGILAFGPGMVVQTEFLVTPDTNVPLILGTPILQENQMSIDFQARQLMMGTESSSVNLTFLWKSDQSGQVKVCGAENEQQDEDSTTDNSIGDTRRAKEQNSPDIKEICQLVKTEANSKNGLRILATVSAFRDVFALHDSELGRTHLVEHDVDTGKSGPIKLAPYRLAPGKMSIVKSEIEDMLTRGIIRPSNSPYSAPIVLVTKKDGSNRMCVDFRKLNDVTRKDAFPLPQIDQIVDHFHGAKVFSSLDLASGYWQVPLS